MPPASLQAKAVIGISFIVANEIRSFWISGDPVMLISHKFEKDGFLDSQQLQWKFQRVDLPPFHLGTRHPPFCLSHCILPSIERTG